MENNEQDFLKSDDFLNEKLVEFRKNYVFELTAEACRKESEIGIEKIKLAVIDEKNRFLSHCEHAIKSVRIQGEFELYIDIQRAMVLKDFIYVSEYIDDVMDIIKNNGFVVRKEPLALGGDYLYISWVKSIQT